MRSDVWSSDVVSFDLACRWCVGDVVYRLELRYGVGSMMVVGVVESGGGGYAPAGCNCVLWITSNNEIFLSGFVLL